MVTTKPRVFVTLDKSRFLELQKIASRSERPLSQTASEILGIGLDVIEDEWLSEIGDQRLAHFDIRKAIPFKAVERKLAKKSRAR